MTTDILTCLAAIPDRRRAEGKIYGQAGVILFSILAMVSGARSYRQIHTLIDRRLCLLNAAFPGAALHAFRAAVRPACLPWCVHGLRRMPGALSGVPSPLGRGGPDANDPPESPHDPCRPRRDRSIAGANRSLGSAL